jgi:hypothetical protein
MANGPLLLKQREVIEKTDSGDDYSIEPVETAVRGPWIEKSIKMTVHGSMKGYSTL